MKLILMAKTKHPSNKEVVHYSLKWIAQAYELVVNKSFTYKEPIIWIFHATPNSPKSCTMQKM